MRLRHDPKTVKHVTDAKDFGRVAVLFGGTSTEREISLLSGNACLQALLKRGVDAHPFDPRDRPLNDLVTRKFDRVFIALHGPGGEDGTLQGALEFLGLPYTGSGVMGSAIGMDKLRTKRLAQAVGIPTTDYMVLRSPADLETCLERLGLPLIVKPATQGSSVGMTKVEKAGDLAAAYQAAALLKRGVDAHPFDPRDKPLNDLVTRKFDRVFIALHGPGGEDGTLQGALEFLGLPYTGSGVMGSAIGMDKLRTKRLAQAVGIPTTDYMVLRSPADLETCLERLGLPLIVKPATQGSSVGMTKVEKAGDLAAAYQAAALLEPNVFAEPWITGGEYTVAVLHGRALPSIRIETPATFYDYQAKYFRSDTKYFCPSGLSAEAEKHLANLAIGTFAAVGAEGWGRADFMMDKAGKPYLLEINTVPGMTDHSLVPMAARALEISFEQLVWQVLETSFTRTSIA